MKLRRRQGQSWCHRTVTRSGSRGVFLLPRNTSVQGALGLSLSDGEAKGLAKLTASQRLRAENVHSRTSYLPGKGCPMFRASPRTKYPIRTTCAEVELAVVLRASRVPPSGTTKPPWSP
jgi:hypothetical protein